ncbi:restriction endonuclease subunit S [Streptomyces griseoluteus]|uniref:restriction endonuclease subunit S n=1 Tax=Streptomyces griseoluteus TaxID=29306 RepID=UPI0036E97AAB
MSGLPSGWVRVNLDEIAEVQGGIQKQQKRRPVNNAFPFLRVANVGSGSLDLREVHEVELFEGELERFVLRAGDLLVVEGNGSIYQLGRAARWSGEIENCVHQNHLIRVRPGPAISAKFLELLWNSSVISEQLRSVAASTSGLHTLSTAKLKRVSVPLPPMEEQLRIVAAIEEQLSRLDAASRVLDVSERRIERYLQAALHEMTSGHSLVSLRDVLGSGLTNGRSVPTRAGGFPVLRLTALADTCVDLSQSKEGDWEESDAEPFFVRRGDFLIARGNGSLSLVGRGSLVADVPSPVAYPDTMIRARPDSRKILPEYLRTIWSSVAVRRQIESNARTTAGIYKVNQKILGAIEFPLPDLTIQRVLCDQWSIIEQQARHLAQTVSVSKKRSSSLRRSLLAEAFAGRLTWQDPADEPAEVLLARIRAERDAAVRRAPGRRKGLSTTAPASTAPPPSPTDVYALAAATQPTLDLEIPS